MLSQKNLNMVWLTICITSVFSTIDKINNYVFKKKKKETKSFSLESSV